MGPGAFSTNLSIFNGKNWDKWRMQTRAILGYQEVAEVVEEGCARKPLMQKRFFIKRARRRIVKLSFLSINVLIKSISRRLQEL